MPWTVDAPPAVATNKTLAERRVCVAAANASLSRGESEADAVHACIGAMETVATDDEHNRTVKRGDGKGSKRARFG